MKITHVVRFVNVTISMFLLFVIKLEAVPPNVANFIENWDETLATRRFSIDIATINTASLGSTTTSKSAGTITVISSITFATGAGIVLPNGNNIFTSSSTQIGSLTNYGIVAGTASVAANSGLVITPSNCSSIQLPMVSDYSNSNSSTVANTFSVSTWTPGATNFTIRNYDPNTTRQASWWCFCK